MSKDIKSLFCDAFDEANEKQKRLIQNFGGNQDFYFQILDEVTSPLIQYSKDPFSMPAQSLAIFFYGLRDLSTQGEVLLESISALLEGKQMSDDLKETLHQCSLEVQRNIAVSSLVRNDVLRVHPTLKIVPPCRERTQP